MKLAFYTGPVAVLQIADRMREAGVNVICEGTERVWIEHKTSADADGARLEVLRMIVKHHGNTLGLYHSQTEYEMAMENKNL